MVASLGGLTAACDKGAPPPAYPSTPEGPGASAVAPEEASRTNDPTSPLNFQGKIAKSYEDSEEWWPPTYTPAPDNAPNVVLILLDDTGFAQFGSFGGLTETPNIVIFKSPGVISASFLASARSCWRSFLISCFLERMPDNFSRLPPTRTPW